MKPARTILILSHRYLGLVISLIFIIWFATGMVMIYTGGMPGFSPAQRLQNLEILDFDRIDLDPREAAGQAGLHSTTLVPTLLNIDGRPAYRFPDQAVSIVFADTGEYWQSAGTDDFLRIAARFVGADPRLLQHAETLTQPDQWTLGMRGLFPLEKFTVEDGDQTEVYVSPRLAEVVLSTTRSERAMAWVGAIPHWFYFLPLRQNSSLWVTVVAWTAGIGCVLAVLGLLLGFTQFRRTRPFSLARSIPYRGLMRWHYLLGVIFGLFALTWAFSGMLSVEPFAWTRAPGLNIPPSAISGGAVNLSEFDSPGTARLAQLQEQAGGGIREVTFVRIQGGHYYLLRQARNSEAPDAPQRELLVESRSMALRQDPFATEALLQSIEASLAAVAPEVNIVEHAVLDEYDNYYYSRSSSRDSSGSGYAAGNAPLPVLRIKFDDPAQTWYYLDPMHAEVVRRIHQSGRLERWLYNGFHSLDFAFLYNSRPLWDIIIISLCVGGLGLSAAGLYLGIRRLRRNLSRRSAGLD